AENVGYKKTKRGENPMPNDLYDLEHAPTKLNTNEILEEYKTNIHKQKEQQTIDLAELATAQAKYAEKENETLKQKIEKLKKIIESKSKKIEKLENDHKIVVHIFETYYQNNLLKNEYAERTENELLQHFKKNGLLEHRKSKDIVLRKNNLLTILDYIRNEVSWQ
ncbi:MAG: hypothetical protein EAZ31_07350, partial [Cytophagia bacterium]